MGDPALGYQPERTFIPKSSRVIQGCHVVRGSIKVLRLDVAHHDNYHDMSDLCSRLVIVVVIRTIRPVRLLVWQFLKWTGGTHAAEKLSVI